VKVIFIKDLKKQGHINDVKEVSDGYAVNFLIKNGYAVKYTKASADILNKDLKNIEVRENENIKIARELKKVIDDTTLEFKVKCNKGRVFGSISSRQICDELLKKGISVDKKSIRIDNSISTLGIHNVSINLYKGIVANLRVSLKEA